MAEFAEETHVPKSTLQSVLKEGQTTLDTAYRIAWNLDIPLDTLLRTVLSPQNMKTAHNLLYLLDWYTRLTSDDQQKASQCIQTLLSLIQRGGENEVCL